MRNNVQRPHTSIARLASRTLLALAAALPMALALDIPVSVNIVASRSQAFESDISNYGEIQITRSAALLTSQAITLQLNKGAVAGRYATYGTDFTLQVNPDDAAKATLTTTLAGSGTLVLTFNSTYADARIQIIATVDGAVYPPELGELASISLPIIPPAGIVNGANQRGTVTIVDANVQAATYVDQSPAREILGDDINQLVQGVGDGRMRIWFPNSSAYDNNPITTAYSVYGSRFVSATNAGSSAVAGTDFAATYRIGGNQRCVETIGVVIEPTVTSLRNAFRETTEYGAVDYDTWGVFSGYSDPKSGQVIATGTSGLLTSITTEPITTPSGASLRSIKIGGTTVTFSPAQTVSLTSISQGSVAGKTRIDLFGFTANAPIAQGTEVVINYTVTDSAGVITPGSGTTTVSMPILYPQGATSLSVTRGVSPVQLSKGDVFVVDSRSYRITGTKLTGGGGGSLGDYEIFFTPGLYKDLLRSSPLTIQTHFEAKFDNNNRETFLIPGLPTTTYYGYPNGIPLPLVNIALPELGLDYDEAVRLNGGPALAAVASDLPGGDWVDFIFRPLDDDEVEGREDILISLAVTTATNGYDIINPAVARTPLGDDDVLVATQLKLNAQIPSGDGSFTIQLSQPFPNDDLFVPFTILQNTANDAVFGQDYTIQNTSRNATTGYVTGVARVPKGALSVDVKVTPVATSPIPLNESRAIRVVLDDSLDYALVGSSSSSTNASASTVTITKTPNNTNPVPSITSPSVAIGTVGTSFLYTIITNPTATSFTASGLPPGLNLDILTGAISGIPTSVGPSNATITATSTGGTSLPFNLAISIGAGLAPVITNPTLTANGVVGTGFSYQIQANGSPSSFGASGLPAGLTIDTATGAIAGTPQAVGSSSVTISATNLSGIGSATLGITIVAGTGPVISSPLSATATVGTAFTYTIVASGSPTSYSATGLPAGLALDTATGTISGTPTAVGVSSVTIGATNSGGVVGTATLSLTVSATGATTNGTTTTNPTTGNGNGSGGLCGAGSGLAILLGSLSLIFVRFTGKRR